MIVSLPLDAVLPPVDVAPPTGPLNEPLVLFGIAAFGFAVVMIVWMRRRRAARGE